MTPLKCYSPRMRISTSPREYKKEGTKKAGPIKGPASSNALARLVNYRTILRARSPPATSSAPAPRAISEAPPVSGSAAAPAAAVAPAEAEAAAVAAAAAVASSPSTTMSSPAATPPRQALTCSWLMPSSWAMAAALPRSPAVASPYWPWAAAAAWTCEQSTYWTSTSPATACAKAGAAAARTMASIAANNIIFLNSIPPCLRITLRAAFFHFFPPMSTPFTAFFPIFLKLLNIR
jgi:hypothetical protein